MRVEVPDPHPHALLRHKWAEAVAVAQLRFNRIVLYDGRRLHNRYIILLLYYYITIWYYCIIVISLYYYM